MRASLRRFAVTLRVTDFRQLWVLPCFLGPVLPARPQVFFSKKQTLTTERLWYIYCLACHARLGGQFQPYGHSAIQWSDVAPGGALPIVATVGHLGWDTAAIEKPVRTWCVYNVPRPNNTVGQKRRLMYIEPKSGHDHNGPRENRLGTFSKTGRSIYSSGKRFERLQGRGISGNYFDVDTGEEYWISGVKKQNTHRHWAGSGPIDIDVDAREEYESYIRGKTST